MKRLVAAIAAAGLSMGHLATAGVALAQDARGAAQEQGQGPFHQDDHMRPEGPGGGWNRDRGGPDGPGQMRPAMRMTVMGQGVRIHMECDAQVAAACGDLATTIAGKVNGTTLNR